MDGRAIDEFVLYIDSFSLCPPFRPREGGFHFI